MQQWLGDTALRIELKYGLSVTGIVHPEKFLTNANARPGDLLILTKPLGTGILATALKAGELDKDTTKQITELMATLNKDAAEAIAEVGANACTDVTGFGLLGHGLEMARASNVGIKIDTKKVPVIPVAKTFASMGLVPGEVILIKAFALNILRLIRPLIPFF